MFHKLKHIVKVILGREIWVRTDRKIPMEFHGSEYGGWAIAGDSLAKDSIIYSFGVGEDVTFDLSLIGKYGCDVYGFDPTPRSLAWVKSQSLDPRFKMVPVGLGAANGEFEFFSQENEAYVSFSTETRGRGVAVKCPVKSLATLMKELGHDHVDLLKMDIEGSEYEVIDELRKNPVPVKQILVEFHHRMVPGGRAKTLRAIATLRALGYDLVKVSKRGEEFTFVSKTVKR